MYSDHGAGAQTKQSDVSAAVEVEHTHIRRGRVAESVNVHIVATVRDSDKNASVFHHHDAP